MSFISIIVIHSIKIGIFTKKIITVKLNKYTYIMYNIHNISIYIVYAIKYKV